MEDKLMDNKKLLDTALQVYARACNPNCSKEMHERAFELKNEILRRLDTKQSILTLVDDLANEFNKRETNSALAIIYGGFVARLLQLKQKIEQL